VLIAGQLLGFEVVVVMPGAGSIAFDFGFVR
jgi:hypothetical protein